MARRTKRAKSRRPKRAKSRRPKKRKTRGYKKRQPIFRDVAGVGQSGLPPIVPNPQLTERITHDDAKRLLSNILVDEQHEHYNNLMGQLMDLEHDPEYISPYYVTHAQRLQSARDGHVNIYGTLAEHIARYRQIAEEDGDEYTPEYEQEDRERYNRMLAQEIASANTYRNDLHNYASALLEHWREDGGDHGLLP